MKSSIANKRAAAWVKLHSSVKSEPAALAHTPFEEWPSPPDVSVSYTSAGRLCDILLLEELLDGLRHHCHSIVDMRRLVFAIDQLKADQTCPVDSITIAMLHPPLWNTLAFGENRKTVRGCAYKKTIMHARIQKFVNLLLSTSWCTMTDISVNI